MSHMVIYRSAEGKPGYHQTEELDDAVSYVESLRNNEGVEHARIFRLEEVTFDFKPYFKVEIGGSSPAPAASAPAVAPAPAVSAPPPAPEPPASVPPPPPAPPASEAPAAEGSPTLAPPAPPAPPETAESSDDDTNGVGARRGLFGR